MMTYNYSLTQGSDRMAYDKALVAGKLRRWEKYMDNYCLPTWEEIPDLGLYMEQVISLLKQYLDYLPPELKGEQFITAATINNYVRTKIMPEPLKKRYYRSHIAYLVMICTLKQGLSIAMIQKLLPNDLGPEELQTIYERFVVRQKLSARIFVESVRSAAGPILDHDEVELPLATDRVEDLVVSYAMVGGFSRLFAEKLLLLEGKDLSNGGSIEVRKTKKK